jgi:hypothetical protein
MTDCPLVLPIEPAARRWRLGEDSGDVFDTDEHFDGLTLTIEILDREEAQRVTHAMLAQIGGVE